LPEEGVIIAHTHSLPLHLKPSAKQFIVEIKPDQLLRCIFANFVIVQNKHDPILRGISRLLISSACVHYWPQARLIPRNPERGDRFENIAFVGKKEQFLKAHDLPEQIEKLGLNWRMIPRDKWHDYSEIDAIVAVRETAIGSNIPAHLSTNRKPASKLLNAWSAGVPAILSPDSAYQDIRKSHLDFIEARTVPEILRGLRQLTSDPLLRRSMVENGKKRAEEFTLEKRVDMWIEILKRQIIPRYHLWTQSRYYRRWILLTRRLVYTIDSGLLEYGGDGLLRAFVKRHKNLLLTARGIQDAMRRFAGYLRYRDSDGPERASEGARNVRRIEVLSRFITPGGVGAELGVYKGYFSPVLLESLAPERLYLIDPWYLQGKQWPWARGNRRTVDALGGILRELEHELAVGKVVLQIDDDLAALTRMPDAHLDWAYLDTTHQYDHTAKELQLLTRKVKAGGIIAGDDWCPDPLHMHHGVYKAVREFVDGKAGTLVHADETSLQWILRLS
jgi:hypothetical protein